MPSPLSRYQLAFATPRKLPRPGQLTGRVVVLDIAFAGTGSSGGFEAVTLPFIGGLGERLRGWVDHHDHSEHQRFSDDPRFVLSTKAEHPACPEMIDEALCARIGPVETVVCHTDFDGLASAAKWVMDGVAPYPECDADARAIDTRMGRPSPMADAMDRALRAHPRDTGLCAAVVRYLATGLEDSGLWRTILQAARQLRPIEKATRRVARQFERVRPGVAILDVGAATDKLDTTLLLLLGQEIEPVAVVLDRNNTHVAARFDSGYNFLELLALAGGMPTRVAVPRSRAPEVLLRLGVEPSVAERWSTPR
jgi:hypothetical protein